MVLLDFFRLFPLRSLGVNILFVISPHVYPSVYYTIFLPPYNIPIFPSRLYIIPNISTIIFVGILYEKYHCAGFLYDSYNIPKISPSFLCMFPRILYGRFCSYMMRPCESRIIYERLRSKILYMMRPNKHGIIYSATSSRHRSK